MSAPKCIEDFCQDVERLSSELTSAVQLKDHSLIQQKLAEFNNLLQYYSTFDEVNSEPEQNLVSECLTNLQSLLSQATELLIAEQLEVTAQLANIKRSKRISSFYQQSNSDEQ